MKKVLVPVLALVVGVMGLVGASTTSASAAGSPGCVSRGEWTKVKPGHRKGAVHRIFETSGRRASLHKISGVTWEYRKYKRCSSGSYWVRYRNNVVKQKLRSVSYANCTEARNARVTPLHRGQPGYASHLDRDGDGIACE